MPIGTGIAHSVPLKTRDALVLMARSFRPIKARRDVEKLKQQRDHKRTKDEIALKIQKDKVSEACVEVMFWWEMHEDGEYRLAIQPATLESSKSSTISSQRNSMKQQTIFCVKGFWFPEFHAA